MSDTENEDKAKEMIETEVLPPQVTGFPPPLESETSIVKSLADCDVEPVVTLTVKLELEEEERFPPSKIIWLEDTEVDHSLALPPVMLKPEGAVIFIQITFPPSLSSFATLNVRLLEVLVPTDVGLTEALHENIA
jgi:hypothetical protein